MKKKKKRKKKEGNGHPYSDFNTDWEATFSSEVL